jgi:hypothetical protein
MDPERWRRISDIAGRALELDASAVGAYLDGACGDDRMLRAEVERILEANAGFDSLLDPSASRTGPRTVGAAPAPSPDRTTDSPTTRLPAELMARAARRLGLVAILYAVGFVLAYLVRETAIHAIGGELYLQRPHTPGQVMTAAFAMLALVVAFIARRHTLSDTRLLQLGLVFEVVGSLGIALVSYSALWDQGVRPWGISWLCAWILVFPLIMPPPPRAATIAALASATMAPVAIVIWAATRDFAFPGTSLILATTVPNFVFAALGILAARSLYRVGLELREAQRLGRYRLVAPLGRGGMGEVWIAEHDLLARPAALKLIRPELISHGATASDAIARFEREAQSTAALTSPHTVRLYDFGVTDDGLFYSVMELLEGLDLEALVRTTGPVPPARAIHFLRQACNSLAEAHARGLVHRDIKPSNLFVCRQGMTFDFVKVLDFGLVRSPSADAADGTVAGTPEFMAPERWTGSADPRSDVYALGGVGMWLLTGRVHAGDQQLPAHIPAALESVLRTCLEPDPALRPQDAAHLDAVLAALPVTRWSQEDAWAWWQEHDVASERTISRLSI